MPVIDREHSEGVVLGDRQYRNVRFNLGANRRPRYFGDFLFYFIKNQIGTWTFCVIISENDNNQSRQGNPERSQLDGKEEGSAL